MVFSDEQRNIRSAKCIAPSHGFDSSNIEPQADQMLRAMENPSSRDRLPVAGLLMPLVR